MAKEPQAAPADKKKNILFADLNLSKFTSLMQLIGQENMTGITANEPHKAVEAVANQHVDLVVLNLLLGGIGPFELISAIRTHSKNPDIKIMVISRQVHKVNIHNTIKAGAHDFVAEPFENEVLLNRILYHLTPKQIINPEGYGESVADARNWKYIKLLLESTETLSKASRTQSHDAFFGILQKIAELMTSNRTSLILVDTEAQSGMVLASSDDATFYDFPINLNQYPEILHVLYSGNFVLVEDTRRNQMTKNISQQVKTIQIGSMMVFPVQFYGDVTGVLTIRRPTAIEIPSGDIMRVLQAVANTMAAHAHVRGVLRKIYKGFTAQTG